MAKSPPNPVNSPQQHTELTNTVTVTATPPASSLPTPVAPSAQNTVSLLDLLLVLVKNRKIIIGINVAAALVSVGVALNMPNIYTATARILPPQQGQSSATAMLGQLGSLAPPVGRSASRIRMTSTSA